MKTSGNTVLITGGSSGIGLALARSLVEAGNEVLVCGRRERSLQEAKEKVPGLQTFVCDVSRRAEREALFRWATSTSPGVNVLVNNAGVQRETDFRKGAPELTDGESEIEINFTASVHLAALFVPHFLGLDRGCAVANVSSGLAFIPLQIVPVYCATKAALHSFSMSLRSQLAGTRVRVFEIIPPIVRTELHRGEGARKQALRGIPPERVADAVMDGFARDRAEITIGQARDLKVASRLAPHFFHRMLNKLVAR